MRCPGYDATKVRPMGEDDYERVIATSTARTYHLVAAHPHLFCGCGTEAATCHPERCCRDDDWGGCVNCGKAAPEPAEQPIPEDELSDPLFATPPTPPTPAAPAPKETR